MNKYAIGRIGLTLLLFCLSLPFFAQGVDRVEYYFDIDPGFGNGTALSVNAQGEVSAAIDVSTLADGMHVLSVRARNTDGVWQGSTHSLVYKYSAANFELSAVEYYIDEDPGFGKGKPLMFEKKNGYYHVTSAIDVSSVVDGMHVLAIRSKNSAGEWSAASHTLVYKYSAANCELAAVEYYIDNDPGFGKGKSLTFEKKDGYYAIASAIDVSTVADGMHVLAIRAKNSAGLWSTATHAMLYKYAAANCELAAVEYFIDDDPGFGKGKSLTFEKKNGYYAIASAIDVSAVTDGMHVLSIRAKNSAGLWSTATHTMLYKYAAANFELAAIEYYIDKDPGLGKGTALDFEKKDGYYHIASTVDVSTIADGMHVVSIRARNSAGIWSAANHSLLYKRSPMALTDTVTSVSYYWDEEDAARTELSFTQVDNEAHLAATLQDLDAFEIDVPHYLFVETRTNRGYMSLSCFEVTRKESFTTGAEQVTVQELKIYPVPFTTQLFIDALGAGDRIVLTDLSGRQLLTTTKVELLNNSLDVAHLPIGTYLLTVYQEQQVISKIVIKQ